MAKSASRQLRFLDGFIFMHEKRGRGSAEETGILEVSIGPTKRDLGI